MAVLVLLAGIAIWSVFIERQLFVIRQDSIQVLPKGFAPVRVLQIGDIHLAPWQKHKMRFLKSLGSLEVDLVVNTGDNLGHKKAVKPLLDCLDPILQKPGIFVNGSNDYFAPIAKNPLGYIFHSSKEPTSVRLDTQEMTAGFENAGWQNLNNKALELKVAGNSIRFLGVDDHHIGYSDFSQLAASNQFTIALTHAPYLDVLEKLNGLGAEMIFAGHTHGGQVRLPFVGALTTNSDLPLRFARGVAEMKFNGKTSILSVVAGLGNSIYAPVRFFCRPEVRVVTLLAKN